MTDELKQEALKALDVIKASERVLLHCHPSSDEDSVGGALAMKFALQQLGKEATIIRGDSALPESFSVLPGIESIVFKSFGEVDLGAFDLFIILDSAAPNMVTRRAPLDFPPSLKTINIDHHSTNPRFGQVNIVDGTSPATCQILFELFELWGVTITSDIAACLFAGIYRDTGGFQYCQTSPRTFEIAANLARQYPSFCKLFFELLNTNTPGSMIIRGIALSSVETFFGGKVAVASVSLADLEKHNAITVKNNIDVVAEELRSVQGWDIDVGMIEQEKNMVKFSFRTRDGERFDVSKVAVLLGGGGHKGAAGATVRIPFEQAKRKLLDALAEAYPELQNL